MGIYIGSTLTRDRTTNLTQPQHNAQPVPPCSGSVPTARELETIILTDRIFPNSKGINCAGGKMLHIEAIPKKQMQELHIQTKALQGLNRRLHCLILK